jgi:hypothetical protein
VEVALCLLAVALVVALGLAVRSALTVSVLEVKAGKIRVASRRSIAPAILNDLRDVVRKPPVASATIRIMRSRGRAEVRFSGTISDAQAQRVRNVIGSVPLAKLVNAG